MDVKDLIDVQVLFSDDDEADEENIDKCVTASIIVDVFGNTFDGEYLLESFYQLEVDLDEYADIVETNLMSAGFLL
ncbi:MAG TPA: hypothetical protein DD379_01815 [Cyanobacteria bacterium UBA11162]|nr:hypothetical protein [Cyanobacteria bacterium UBA11162]